MQRCSCYQHQGTSVHFPGVSSRPRAGNKSTMINLSKEGSGTEGAGVPVYKGHKRACAGEAE